MYSGVFFFGEGNGGEWELGLAYYFGWIVLKSLPIFADLTLCRSEARKSCILFRHRGTSHPYQWPIHPFRSRYPMFSKSLGVSDGGVTFLPAPQ